MKPEEARDATIYQRNVEAKLRGHNRIIVLKAIAHALLYYAQKLGMPTEEMEGLLNRARVAGYGGTLIIAPGGAGAGVGSPDNPDRQTRRQINAALRIIYAPLTDHPPGWAVPALGTWALMLCESCGVPRDALVGRLAVLDRAQRIKSKVPRPFVEATEAGGVGY